MPPPDPQPDRQTVICKPARHRNRRMSGRRDQAARFHPLDMQFASACELRRAELEAFLDVPHDGFFEYAGILVHHRAEFRFECIGAQRHETAFRMRTMVKPCIRSMSGHPFYPILSVISSAARIADLP
jgi:hypothetical protein